MSASSSTLLPGAGKQAAVKGRIGFPRSEHKSVRKWLDEHDVLYTSRTQKEIGKYPEGSVHDTPWGHTLEVESVKKMDDLEQHPFKDQLLAWQKKQLKGRPFELVKFKKRSAAYSPPYDVAVLKEKYPRLLDDPVHRWRAEQGVELVHREPTVKELKRIIMNWKLMTDEQKAMSDAKSMELFGKGNMEHAEELDKKASITLDIEKGDTLLGGRFKNVKHTVKDIGTDELGQPTINGMKLLAFRIAKQMPKSAGCDALSQCFNIIKESLASVPVDAGVEKQAQLTHVFKGVKMYGPGKLKPFLDANAADVKARMWKLPWRDDEFMASILGKQRRDIRKAVREPKVRGTAVAGSDLGHITPAGFERGWDGTRPYAREAIAHEAFHARHPLIGMSETLAYPVGAFMGAPKGAGLGERLSNAIRAVFSPHTQVKKSADDSSDGLSEKAAASKLHSLWRAGKFGRQVVENLQTGGFLPSHGRMWAGMERGNENISKQLGPFFTPGATSAELKSGVVVPVGMNRVSVPDAMNSLRAARVQGTLTDSQMVEQMRRVTDMKLRRRVAGDPEYVPVLKTVPVNNGTRLGSPGLNGRRAGLTQNADDWSFVGGVLGQQPVHASTHPLMLKPYSMRHELDEFTAAQRKIKEYLKLHPEASEQEVIRFRARQPKFFTHVDKSVLRNEFADVSTAAPEVQDVLNVMRQYPHREYASAGLPDVVGHGLGNKAAPMAQSVAPAKVKTSILGGLPGLRRLGPVQRKTASGDFTEREHAVEKSAKTSIVLPDGNTPLAALLRAKARSDAEDYAAKHAIMRRLIAERPEEFEIDSEDKNVYGLTHTPTGFRMHLPRKVVAELLQPDKRAA